MNLDPSVLQRLRAWYHSPLLFTTECIGVQPSDQQAEALVALGESKRTTIRSGHGIGKDALASWCILWFLSTRAYSKVVCTAPTARQLSDILWAELAKWLRQSKIREEFVHHKDILFHKDYQKEWWARAVSASVRATKEDQAETLAGFHADHLFMVVDEASGVPDPVFVPLEGAMTQEDNRVLLIGNMTKNSGYFYDSHFHPTINKAWTKFHFDSRKSSNVKAGYCEYMAAKYGVDSNVFRIRVAGEPPIGDANTLIALAWAEQCIGNDIVVPEDEPLYLGVDVARYGDDKSIILPRTGNIVHPWNSFSNMNTISLGGHILMAYAELEARGLAVDEIGVGAGVTDWLYKQHVPNMYGINSSTQSSDASKYDILRDELWWRVREKCMRAEYSFPTETIPGEVMSLGQELANELSMPTYTHNAQGGIVVESKRKMKARGVLSPNIADALCLSEYFSNIATKVFKTKSNKAQLDRWRERFANTPKRPNRNAWMRA